MKKSLILTLTLLALLVAFAGSTTAQGVPVSNLTTLANYAPDSTMIYASLRIDTGFVAEIDALLAYFAGKMPPEAGAPPLAFNLDMLLDDFIREAVDENLSFESAVRPWIGDTLAGFIPSLESTMMDDDPGIIAVEITDQTGAKAFFDMILADEIEGGYYTVIEEDGLVIYDASWVYDPSIVITTDALFFGVLSDEITEIVLPGADRVKLGSTATFQTMIATLPEDNYNILGYVDLSEAVKMLATEAARELPLALADLLDPAALNDRLGQQAIGLTVLQGRSLVIDVVHNGAVDTPGDPLDLGFLQRVPADTALLAQTNGFGDQVRQGLAMLEEMDARLIKLMADVPADEIGPLADFRFRHLGTFMQLSFEGTTGLDFEKTLNWMNGDMAMFVSLPAGSSPLFSNIDPGFKLEQGLVVATNSPVETEQFITVVYDALLKMYATTRMENGMLVVPLGDLISKPELGTIALGSNDAVLAGGTYDSVMFALNPDGNDISHTPTFMFEQGVFLPDAGTLLYADLAPIRAALDSFLKLNPELVEEPAEVEALRALLTLFDTASITTVYTEEGGKIRFSLTLGE